MRKMPQTRFAQTVCHFSHNADFDQLRISKYPANAHEINYFSMLVVGSFKYTLTELNKSPAEVANIRLTKHYSALKDINSERNKLK